MSLNPACVFILVICHILYSFSPYYISEVPKVSVILIGVNYDPSLPVNNFRNDCSERPVFVSRVSHWYARLRLFLFESISYNLISGFQY